jgi:TonB family protein
MRTQAKIPNPCLEDWNSMKIGLNSRFCDNCTKSVIDFTEMSRQEILEYLLTNYDKKVCGKIYKSQLDFTHSDYLLTIKSLSSKHKNSNISFFLLTVGTLILSGCDTTNNETANFKTESVPKIEMNRDSVQIYGGIKKANGKIQKKKNKLHIPIEPIIETGDIQILEEPLPPQEFIDIMPEYEGGLDSLIHFLNTNIQYPTWEKENKLEGTVYVTFVIDKNGKIIDPKISNTVPNSKNFDTEAIRVIKKMPNWIPGRHEGNYVDIQFNLPIQFKL